jgi:diguanylate cyclase (GGDEF)-like protein
MRPAIVCVDDDGPLLRSLREQLLRGLGQDADIELASGGEEALQLLDELAAEGVPVPLIISDHIMPGLRGADLLAQVHQRHPAMLKVLLTGEADVDAVSRAVNDASLYRVLAKPWHEEDLILTVKEALRRAGQEQQLAQRSAELAGSNLRLAQSLKLLQATMDATRDGLLVLGGDGLPMQVNRQFLDLWSVPAALADGPPGRALLEHLHAQLREPASLKLDPRDALAEAAILMRNDEREIEVSGREFRLQGVRAGMVYCFRDVTERERGARLIRHQALHDGLSGLPNRSHFSAALDAAITDARADERGVAVLFVDLDHFKRVNDTLGHDAGDALIKSVAVRLSHCLREDDLVARWGGDEFTILLRRMHSPAEATVLADRVLRALDEPFWLTGMSLQMSASVGVASFPSDGDDGAALLRRADLALYRAKDEGRNAFRVFHRSSFGETAPGSDLSLEADLRRAIEHAELELHYQPQIDTRSGLVTGVEALARWNHAERGWIGPAEFIPMAERSRHMVALGEWILRAACRQAALWREQGLGEWPVAVNLSPTQFDRGDLEAAVASALAAAGLPPHLLELEVTESVALRHMGITARKLAALRAGGVRIALDDFGTGYASLAYLKHLPCDKLKIDRSFISAVNDDPKDAAIVRGLLALTEGLGLHIVAEGVESRPVAQALQSLGCWTMQGYLFCRPMPASALTPRLRELAPRLREPAVI